MTQDQQRAATGPPDDPADDPADGWFGESVAADYDSDDGVFAPEVVERTADVLAELADGGPALELAIGTGRIAVPLARRGVAVHGIELSRAMAARIAGKPGAEKVQVTIGDMTTTRVPGEYTLAYLVFNTIGNVTTQEGQVDCFLNAAGHLRRGGRFVIETGVPPLRRLPPGQECVAFTVAPDSDGGYVGVDRIDTVTQVMTSNHVRVRNGAGRFRALPQRYVWPSELDLMARIAGMRLTHRWEDWDRSPFGHESTKHVSVWERV